MTNLSSIFISLIFSPASSLSLSPSLSRSLLVSIKDASMLHRHTLAPNSKGLYCEQKIPYKVTEHRYFVWHTNYGVSVTIIVRKWFWSMHDLLTWLYVSRLRRRWRRSSFLTARTGNFTLPATRSWLRSCQGHPLLCSLEMPTWMYRRYDICTQGFTQQVHENPNLGTMPSDPPSYPSLVSHCFPLSLSPS